MDQRHKLLILLMNGLMMNMMYMLEVRLGMKGYRIEKKPSERASE